jgi:hypothetical protein
VALRRADQPSKESYQLSIKCKIKEPRKRRPRTDMGCKRHWMDGSSHSSMLYGVSQDSTLRPLLFNICIHDLCGTIYFSDFLLFADDINTFPVIVR